MRNYVATIETRVRGIPCLIGVNNFERHRGSFSYNAPSHDDYYGHTEFDWELLDRKGYRADWLAKKLTDADIDFIEDTIVNHL